MSRMFCTGCKKIHTDYNWQTKEGEHGWHCSRWFTSSIMGPIEKIKSRVRMPDGTVLSGRQGIKILDERRKMQEKSV